jgi:hypothetical protein
LAKTIEARAFQFAGRPEEFAPAGNSHERVAFIPGAKEFDMAELKSTTRNKLPAKDFAEPDKRAYPIEDKSHAQNAKARANQAVNAGRMSKAEGAKIETKANAVLKKS